jgi:hypothetical protein
MASFDSLALEGNLTLFAGTMFILLNLAASSLLWLHWQRGPASSGRARLLLVSFGRHRS